MFFGGNLGHDFSLWHATSFMLVLQFCLSLLKAKGKPKHILTGNQHEHTLQQNDHCHIETLKMLETALKPMLNKLGFSIVDTMVMESHKNKSKKPQKKNCFCHTLIQSMPLSEILDLSFRKDKEKTDMPIA